MLDSRAEPMLNQVAPHKHTSDHTTDPSRSSEASELLSSKYRPTVRSGYGSTTPLAPLKVGREVMVSNPILVSAIANLSTAVRHITRT